MNALAFVALFASTNALTTIARWGCDGGIDFMDGVAMGPLSMRTNGFVEMSKFIESEMKEMSRSETCGCPSLTDQQLATHFQFTNPEFLLNLAKGFEMEQLETSCDLPSLFGDSSDVSKLVKFEMPSSCTLARWRAGEGCQVKFAVSNGFNIHLRVEKCADTDSPMWELACDGPACERMLASCTNSNDCGGALQCLPLTKFTDQCAKETCEFTPSSFGRGYVDSRYESATLSQCGANAGTPVPVPGTTCALDNGAKVGAGFTYFRDANDVERTKTPQSEREIGSCESVTCGASGEWETTMGDAYECFDALTEPAERDCNGNWSRKKNRFWPYTYENTCELPHSYVDAGGSINDVTVFAVGTTRYVSDVNRGLGAVFGYDAVDLEKDPKGCRPASQLWKALKTFLRDGHAANSAGDVLGLCVPGSGFSLGEEMGPSGFKTYFPQSESPETIVEDLTNIDCPTTCANEPLQQQCAISCGSPSPFEYPNAPAYSAAQKFDGASKRKARSVTPVTAGAKVLGHFQCDGSLAFLPNHPILGVEFKFTPFVEYAMTLRSEHRQAYQCRAATHGGSLSEAAYNVRSFTFDNLLHSLTKPVSTQVTNLGATFADLRIRDATTRLKMPSTCTFDNWHDQGQCRMTWTGLSQSALFDEQADLNMYVSICPGSFVPEMYLECVGSACAVFDGPKPCASKADCPAAGFSCDEYSALESTGAGEPARVDDETCGRRRSVDEHVSNAMQSLWSSVGEHPLVTALSAHPLVGQLRALHKRATAFVADAGARKLGKRQTNCPAEELTQYAQCVSARQSSSCQDSASCACIEAVAQCFEDLDCDDVRETAANSCDAMNCGSVCDDIRYSRASAGAVAGGTVAFSAFGIGVQDQSKASLPQCQIDADYLGLQYLPKLFSKIIGKPHDPSKNKLCYFDNTVQPSGKTRSTEWAESLASVDGDTITITHLKPWSENVVIKPVDGGTTIANMGWLEEVADSPYNKNRPLFEDSGATALATSSLMALIAFAFAI